MKKDERIEETKKEYRRREDSGRYDHEKGADLIKGMERPKPEIDLPSPLKKMEEDGS